MVRIELSTLRAGLNELTLSPSAESLDLDAEVFENIRVVLTLDVAADRILARYTILAEAHLLCDRTAEPFVQQVEGSHVVLFSKTGEADAEGHPQDAKAFAATDRYLDLTDEVRDTLVLSMPVRRIAPGAEEVDIPTQFGDEDDDGIDPRWDELRKLQN